MQRLGHVILLALALALAGCNRPELLPEGSDDPGGGAPQGPPRMVLSAAQMRFMVPFGGANPEPQTLVVANAGGGTLVAPTVTIDYDVAPGTPANWLTVGSPTGSDPYHITVQPVVTDVTPEALAGPARLTISSPGAEASEQTVRVFLSLDASRYAATPQAVHFAALQGSSEPLVQVVTVEATLAGRIVLPAPTAVLHSSSDMSGGAPSWLTAQVTGFEPLYSLTLQAEPSVLPPGRYTGYVHLFVPSGAVLPISSLNTSSADTWTSVTLDVLETPPPSAVVAPSVDAVHFAAAAGTPDPPARTFTVTDALGGTLAKPTTLVSYQTPSTGWLSVDVLGTEPPWTIRVQAHTAAIPVGTHSATLTLSVPGGVDASMYAGLGASEWLATTTPIEPRNGHSATPLPDGRVLLVGGSAAASLGLFENSETLRVATTPQPAVGVGSLAPLASARMDHTATLVADGDVVVVGGFDTRAGIGTGGTFIGAVGSTWELFDSVTQTWLITRPLLTPRVGHIAILLQDGRVLIAGGSDVGPSGPPVSSVEILDPVLATSSLAAPMAIARRGASAALLADGRVLVAGGTGSSDEVLASAELFDPRSGTWAPTGSLNGARTGAALVTLANGTVLAAGGSDGRVALATAEIYDPRSIAWSPTGSMATPRVAPAVLLSDGKVLLVAGATGLLTTATATTEIYDPDTGTWSSGGNLQNARSRPAVALTATGFVVVSGGDWPTPPQLEVRRGVGQ